MVILGIVLILGTCSFASATQRSDRACLVSLMDKYLAAVVKHDPAGVPIASDVKLVENLQQIPIGKGLRETATGGPTDFKVYAADPDQGQIGFIGVIEEKQKPTIVSVRLRVVNGKIYEIEAIGYVAKHGITNGWE